MTITYKHETYPGGYVRFASERFVFVRYRGKWEFYLVRQSGKSRGLEMFAGYVDDPQRILTLENAASAAAIPIRPDTVYQTHATARRLR